MARESKLDDLVEKRICDALKAGHSYAAAARAGGICESTLHGWRERGRSGTERRYTEFLQRTEAADQEAEERAIQVIQSALMGTDLRLATDTAWKWLARRRPEQWAEVKGEPEKPLSEQEAKEILAAFARERPGEGPGLTCLSRSKKGPTGGGAWLTSVPRVTNGPVFGRSEPSRNPERNRRDSSGRRMRSEIS